MEILCFETAAQCEVLSVLASPKPFGCFVLVDASIT